MTDTDHRPTDHGPTAHTGPRRPFGRTPARRWWRALDQLTLETMNPPIPSHVRAALGDVHGAVHAPAPGGNHTD